MGFWDALDGASVITRGSSHSRKRPKSSSSGLKRSSSLSRHRRPHHQHHPRRSSGAAAGLTDTSVLSGAADSHARPSTSNRNGSSFSTGGRGHSRSFLGLGRPLFFPSSSTPSPTATSSSSYYKRSPRAGFVRRLYRKLRRLLRDLVRHARRHPLKVLALVVVPLITGGALTALLARFGLRLPPGVERLLGMAAQTASGRAGAGAGLIGEAVRMATNLGGSGRVTVERGRRDDLHWQRSTTDSHSGDGWGKGLMAGMAHMFS